MSCLFLFKPSASHQLQASFLPCRQRLSPIRPTTLLNGPAVPGRSELHPLEAQTPVHIAELFSASWWRDLLYFEIDSLDTGYHVLEGGELLGCSRKDFKLAVL